MVKMIVERIENRNGKEKMDEILIRDVVGRMVIYRFTCIDGMDKICVSKLD